MKHLDISVIILSLNEEKHIRRCLESASQIADQLFVVDCYSTDKTAEIAESLGAKIYYNKWPGLYAVQFNWALDNLPIKTKWVLRLDADEYLSPDLIHEIKTELPSIPDDITGVLVKLGRVFLGRKIKHGTSGIKLLRLFKYKYGRCEERFMDEHITLSEGETIEFQNELVDHNLNNLGWWTQKHNGYAVREAIDLLDTEYDLSNVEKRDSNCDIGLPGCKETLCQIKIRTYAALPTVLPLFFL